jgi:hypothetical protein
MYLGIRKMIFIAAFIVINLFIKEQNDQFSVD